MKIIQKNEQGFGAIEGIFVLVIVVLLGLVGFLVYKNHNKPTAAVSTVTSTPNKVTNSPATTHTTTQAVDQYAGWKTYTSKFGFTFKYPVTGRVDDNTTDSASINDKMGPNSVDVFVYADGYSATNCPVTNPSAFPDCLAKVEFTLHSDTTADGVIVNSASPQLKQTAQLVIDSYKKKGA